MGGTGSTLARALPVRFYAAFHASLHPRQEHARQARLHHGGQRRDGDLSPARQQSNRIAQLFRSLGLRPGDHIALFLENNVRFFEICWAAQRAPA
jgi:hypothetical protein